MHPSPTKNSDPNPSRGAQCRRLLPSENCCGLFDRRQTSRGFPLVDRKNQKIGGNRIGFTKGRDGDRQRKAKDNYRSVKRLPTQRTLALRVLKKRQRTLLNSALFMPHFPVCIRARRRGSVRTIARRFRASELAIPGVWEIVPRVEIGFRGVRERFPRVEIESPGVGERFRGVEFQERG